MLLRALHLFLLIVSVTFAFDPRAAALQRREPDPGFSWQCCKDTTGLEPASDAAIVDQGSIGRAGRLRTPAGRFEPPRKPYPTRMPNPVITESGTRYMAGVLAVNEKQTKVILIKDRTDPGGGWRFPETDWAETENRIGQAVARESWQTAGIPNVNPRMTTDVGFILKGSEPRWESVTDYHKYEVKKLAKTWPNQDRWMRQWADLGEATTLLATHHPEQLEILQRLQLKRDSWAFVPKFLRWGQN